MIKVNLEDIIELVEQAQAEAKNSFACKILYKYGPEANILAEDIADKIFGHQAGQNQEIFQIVREHKAD